MAVSKNNFFDHLRCFRTACRAAGAEAIISLESWQAFVRQGEKHVVFYPQFQAAIKGQLQYQPVLTDDSSMFAGWSPYRLKRWETAVDKLAFKRYSESVGLETPRHWLKAQDVPEKTGVVVKSPKSSFGAHVLGPFRDCGQHPLDIALGEYYEEFLEGKILKVWFWNAMPVCAESEGWSTVSGDGVQNLEQMTLQRATRFRSPDDAEKALLLDRSAQLFRYYGRGLDHVLAKGAKQVVDFRYGSFLMNAADRTVIDFARGELPSWFDQIRDAGHKLHEAIPADTRPNTLFVADGMLLKDGRVRFLEVNCNPTIHPLVYPFMLRDLLPAPIRAEAAAVH